MGWRGFTLVELLVVLAVGSILLAIALPGYAFLTSANRLAAVTNDMVTALQLTRSEAVKRGVRVTMCKTGGTAAVPPVCDAAADWHEGWLVFVDGGSRGVIDGDDLLLRMQERAQAEVGITTYNYSQYVSYLPSGRSQGSNNLPNGTIQICVNGARRDIVINSAGRLRLASGIC